VHSLAIAIGIAATELVMSGPNWKEVADTTQAFATAGGIVVGGVFAYYKFVKDRIYRPRVDLDIQAGAVELGDGRFLKCAVIMRNRGATRIKIDRDATALLVAPERRPDSDFQVMRWMKDEGAVVGVFENHSWLESTETVRDEVLVRVPDDTGVAYRLRLRVVVRRPEPLIHGNISIATTRVVEGSRMWQDHGAPQDEGGAG
jgi:hypothetical protein